MKLQVPQEEGLTFPGSTPGEESEAVVGQAAFLWPCAVPLPLEVAGASRSAAFPPARTVPLP